MSAAEIFDSIFNPFCTALDSVFTPLFSVLGAGVDTNELCLSVGSIFRSLLTVLG
jgi:hypothetical protein